MPLPRLKTLALLLLGVGCAQADPTAIPMTEKGTATWFVTAAIGNESIELLVDTGAGYTTLNQTLLRRLKASGEATRIGEIEGILANGAICVLPVYRIARLNLGGCELENIEVAETPSDARNLLGLSALKKAAPFTFSLDPAELRLSNCNKTVAETTGKQSTSLSSLY